MDSSTIPAAYAPFLRSVIAEAIRQAQRDAAVRDGKPAPAGYQPIPDTMLDARAKDFVVVAVIPLPSEDAQARTEQWPDEPAPGVQRFPGFARGEPKRRSA